MNKVDYNIEFCHIFTNQKFSYDQRLSSELAQELIKKLKEKDKSYVTTILIDDYQPSYSYLDIYDFLERIKKLGLPPTYIVYETKLAPLAKQLISNIDEENIEKDEEELEIKSDKDDVLLNSGSVSSISLKKEYFVKLNKYIETPALIAAWYLLRLGVLKRPGIVKETKYTEKVPFVGKKIVTIIPNKYKEIDEKAKRILSYTKYKDQLDNIKNVYFSPERKDFSEILKSFEQLG